MIDLIRKYQKSLTFFLLLVLFVNFLSIEFVNASNKNLEIEKEENTLIDQDIDIDSKSNNSANDKINYKKNLEKGSEKESKDRMYEDLEIENEERNSKDINDVARKNEKEIIDKNEVISIANKDRLELDFSTSFIDFLKKYNDEEIEEIDRMLNREIYKKALDENNQEILIEYIEELYEEIKKEEKNRKDFIEEQKKIKNGEIKNIILENEKGENIENNRLNIFNVKPLRSARNTRTVQVLDSFDNNRVIKTIQSSDGLINVRDLSNIARNYSVDFTKHQLDNFIDVNKTNNKLYLIPDYVEFDVEYTIPFQLNFSTMEVIGSPKTYKKKALIKHNMKSKEDIFIGEGFYKYIGANSSYKFSDVDLERILYDSKWSNYKFTSGFYGEDEGRVVYNPNFTIEDLKRPSKRKLTIDIPDTSIYSVNANLRLIDKKTKQVVSTFHLLNQRIDVDGYTDDIDIDISKDYSDILSIPSGQSIIDRVREYSDRIYIELDKRSKDMPSFKYRNNSSRYLFVYPDDINIDIEVDVKDNIYDVINPKVVYVDDDTLEILDYSPTTYRNGSFYIQSKDETYLDLDRHWNVRYASDRDFLKQSSYNSKDFGEERPFLYSRNGEYPMILSSAIRKVYVEPKPNVSFRTMRVQTVGDSMLDFRPGKNAENSAIKGVDSYFDYKIRRPREESKHKILSMNIFHQNYYKNNKGIEPSIKEHFNHTNTRTVGAVSNLLENVSYDSNIEPGYSYDKFSIIKGDTEIKARGKRVRDVFDEFHIARHLTEYGRPPRTAVMYKVENIGNLRFYDSYSTIDLNLGSNEEIYKQELLFPTDYNEEDNVELFKKGKIKGQLFHRPTGNAVPKGIGFQYAPASFVYTREGKYTDFTIKVYNNRNKKNIDTIEIKGVSHDIIPSKLIDSVMGYKEGYTFDNHDYRNKSLTNISYSGYTDTIKTYYNPNRVKVNLKHYDRANGKILENESQLTYVGDTIYPKNINYDNVRLYRSVSSIEVPTTNSTELTLNVNYYARDAKMKVIYRDMDTGETIKTDTVNGKFYDKISNHSSKFKNYPNNYNFVNIKHNDVLLNPTEEVVVNMRRDKTVLNLRFVDDLGNVIGTDKIEGNKGEDLIYTPVDRKGYNLVNKDPIVIKNPTLNSYNRDIKYERKEYTITVDYLNAYVIKDKELKERKVIKAKYKDRVVVKAPDIKLTNLVGDEDTIIIDPVVQDEHIVFNYMPERVNVDISYIDIDTNEVLYEETYNPMAHMNFYGSVKKIEGYDFIDTYIDGELFSPGSTTSIRIEKMDKENYDVLVRMKRKNFSLAINGISDSKYLITNKDTEESFELTSKNGKAFIDDLDIGNYKIEQIYVPDGYRMNNKIISIGEDDIIESNFKVNIDFNNYKSIIVPETGGYGMIPFILLGFVIIFFSIYFERNKIRKNNF